MNQPILDDLQFTDNIYTDAKNIIERSKTLAYRTVDAVLIMRNWLLGKRIAIEELNGEDRAKYGAEVIIKLARELTSLYGSGFTKTNLYSYLKFYNYFPSIFHSLSGKSESDQIVYSMSGKSVKGITLTESESDKNCKYLGKLSWTHYRTLLQEANDNAREWYAREAARETWSTRTLQRNISGTPAKVLANGHKNAD